MEINPRLILLAIVLGILFWWKMKALKLANNPVTYSDYLIKLCRITNKQPFEFFVIAGKPHNIPLYFIKNDWAKYIRNSNNMPDYVKEFLDEGKEYIDNQQILI